MTYFCKRCKTRLSTDGLLLWCPACAWEPPESACLPSNRPPCYECESCGRSFATAGALGLHRAQSHQRRAGQPCETCGRPVRAGRAMQLHVLQHLPHEQRSAAVNGCSCDTCRERRRLWERARRTVERTLQAVEAAS